MTTPQATEALQRLLRELPAGVAVARIDRVWLFSPREIAGKESGLVVLSLWPTTGRESDQRELVTVEYEADRVRAALRLAVTTTQQGSAPSERIPRLIEGVLARLGDEKEDPIAHAVGGEEARWATLLSSVGITAVDRPYGE